jgi:hypothetical protein
LKERLWLIIQNFKMYISQRNKAKYLVRNHVSMLFKARKGIRGNLKATERLYEMEAQIP